MYIYIHLVDVYGFHVGKYTVRPMDPTRVYTMNVMIDRVQLSKSAKICCTVCMFVVYFFEIHYIPKDPGMS